MRRRRLARRRRVDFIFFKNFEMSGDRFEIAGERGERASQLASSTD
jgi:hypothetical protein